jgi:hypothetical protein
MNDVQFGIFYRATVRFKLEFSLLRHLGCFLEISVIAQQLRVSCAVSLYCWVGDRLKVVVAPFFVWLQMKVLYYHNER